MSDTHWSTQKEHAAGYWQLAFMLFIFKLLPVVILRIIAFPVGFFYFLFSGRAVKLSGLYLRRLDSFVSSGGGRIRKRLSSLKHIIAFSLALVEKLEAWSGRVSFKRIHYMDDDIAGLLDLLERGEGAFLISSHLGNMEFIRALADYKGKGNTGNISVNAIVDFNVTAHFNRILKKLNPGSFSRIISARELGPDSVVLLSERIKAGELVVIAGDRTSANESSRYMELPFLGVKAPLPYGPFFLAALCEAPVYFVFAMRQKDISLSSHYNIHIHKSPVSFDCPRKERDSRIKALGQNFVSLLEQYCKTYPFQWYNYYDFWLPKEELKRNAAGN